MADRLDDVVMKSVNEVVAETFESLHGRMTMLEAKMQHQWRTLEKDWEEKIVQLEPGGRVSYSDECPS